MDKPRSSTFKWSDEQLAMEYAMLVSPTMQRDPPDDRFMKTHTIMRELTKRLGVDGAQDAIKRCNDTLKMVDFHQDG